MWHPALHSGRPRGISPRQGVPLHSKITPTAGRLAIHAWAILVTTYRNEGDRIRVPENAQSAPQSPRELILADADVARRMILLAVLQDALAALGVRSILARNHRLVLQYSRVPSGPSGQTDPQLHIFAPDGTDIATTDGSTYNLASGEKCPAGDPASAATLITTRPARRAPSMTPAALSAGQPSQT